MTQDTTPTPAPSAPPGSPSKENADDGLPKLSFRWWSFCQPACRVFLQLFFGLRVFGAENLRAANPVLLVSNHQSYFDPMMAGMGGWRHPFFALARKTLWDTPWLGFLLTRLNGIPVDQGAGDLAAMRKCIDVLRGGGRLLMFPEGSRTPTGVMQPFAAGLALILKRSSPTVIPFAVEGSYDAYPIHAKRPRFGPGVGVAYGKPIPPETLAAMKPAEAVRMIEVEVERLRRILVDAIGATPGRDRLDLLPAESQEA
ncbi:MAG: lysophospholipid acyltransferase family protein [Planctomycetota bacterium]